MATVSVCMIVKNEAAVLKRCLDSLAGLWDELIIIDTGSTDDTKDIAQLYTDKVFDFEWVDDFSAARNFAFSKCSMEYIYSVDADEVLDEENRRKFIELKTNILPEIEIVQMWYVNTKEYATTENFSKELRPKLYKRLREFTWIDPIHEAVNLNPVVYDSDIEILHMPQSNHAKRDFSVFKKAINNGKVLSDKLIKMYARELMIAGNKEDFIEARDFFFITSYDQNRDEEIKSYCYCILAKTFRLLECDAEFFKWTLKNVTTTPCAEICIELGTYYFDRQDYEEAAIWYINAISETKPILDANASGEKTYFLLADCYEKMAEKNEYLKEIYLEEAEKYRKMANEFN